MRSPEPRPRAFALLLAAAAALAAAGGAFAAANLGRFPHYGDTVEYLRLSHTLRVDSYRGPLYPLVLHVADRLDGREPFPDRLRWERDDLAGRVPCSAPASLAGLQLVQCLLGLAAIAGFVRVFGATDLLAARVGPRAAAAGALALTGLLAFDPLVAHFQLSLMTDGLCLSACLAACAALVRVGLGSGRSKGAAALLFASVLAAAALRPEKGMVLLGTAATSALVWRARAQGSQRGLLLAVVLCGAAVLAAAVWQRALREDQGRWDLVTTILHQRIVYPRLASIRGDLSPETRDALSEDDANFYDRRIHNTWAVVDRVTGGDAGRRRALTQELAGAALRRHAPAIAADAALDLVEHSVATPSWYARLAEWAARGAPASAYLVRSEPIPRTWAALSAHRPRASLAVTALAATAFLSGAGLALLATARRSAWLREILWPRWVPVLAFTVGNAAVFSFTADLVHVRYALFSHVACLLLVYRGALEWAASRPTAAQRSASFGSSSTWISREPHGQ